MACTFSLAITLQSAGWIEFVLSLRRLEHAHELTLGEDVTLHCLEQCLAIEAVGQIELGVEREQLEVIVMRWIPGRRSRSEIAALAFRIRTLTRRLPIERRKRFADIL